MMNETGGIGGSSVARTAVVAEQIAPDVHLRREAEIGFLRPPVGVCSGRSDRDGRARPSRREFVDGFCLAPVALCTLLLRAVCRVAQAAGRMSERFHAAAVNARQ
jgi:hypothetical protein